MFYSYEPCNIAYANECTYTCNKAMLYMYIPHANVIM